MVERTDKITPNREDKKPSWDMYNELYPTLSELAWKLPQNKFMVGLKFLPKELGKVLYVRLKNDAADLYYNDSTIYSKGQKDDLNTDEKEKFNTFISYIIQLSAGDTIEIKLGFVNAKKSYRLYKDEDGYLEIKDTDSTMKNIRREGGGTSPDPRKDSLDYGARGGNSASPTEFGYNI